MTKKRREPWEQRGAKFHLMGTTKEVCLERAKDDAEIRPDNLSDGNGMRLARSDWRQGLGAMGRQSLRQAW
jgi:hypothetical protein